MILHSYTQECIFYEQDELGVVSNPETTLIQ